MKKCFYRLTAGLLFLLGSATLAQAQISPLQQADNLRQTSALKGAEQYYTSYRVYQLDVAAMRSQLAGAPLEFTGGIGKLLTLPMPQGGSVTFRVFDSPVLSPAQAALNPTIKTYSLEAVNGPASGRLSFINGVLNVVLFEADQGREVYFQAVRGVADTYLSYSTGQVKALPKSGPNALHNSCGTSASAAVPVPAAGSHRPVVSHRTGATLRTYRLAVSADKEFTNNLADGTQNGGLAAVVVYVNMAKGVYRRELSVDFTLVSGTNLVCTNTINPTAFDNTNDGTMLGQNQTFQDTNIGDANYDIGHVLGYIAGTTSGGGVAVRGSLCTTGIKGQGVTQPSVASASFPQVFQDLVFVHEMGHQFNMSHSFNSSVPVCTTREASTSVEPGSGTTIMSYGYTCGGVGSTGDDYAEPGTAGGIVFLNFHSANTAQAVDYITNTATCGTSTATGNSSPLIGTVTTGNTIPKSTPFSLTSTATGGAATLRYSWEGTDVGATAQGGTVPAGTEFNDPSKAPFFRTYAPVATATRTFPLLSSILDGTNQDRGDKLPSVGRTVNLLLTVRDGVGGVTESPSAIVIDGNSGPFLVTSNLSGSYTGGQPQTVTWSVNNTTAAPVSCALVDIVMSTDNGQTFPYTLATATANDGTEVIAMPNIATATTTGRIQVRANGNIFFDISNNDFSLAASAATAAPTLTGLNPTTGPVGTSVTLTGTDFIGATGVKFNGTAAATFNVASATSATATVPAGATTGNVTITTPSGTSNGVSFTVMTATTAPIVTTTTPSIISSSGAVLGGNVTSDGNASVTERGVVYVTGSGTPTTTDTKLTATGTTGSYTASATGLTASTTYTVRAYAINSVGTSYGSSQSFTTSAAVPTSLTISTGSAAAPVSIAAGTYNNVTVTSTGFALLSGAVVVNTGFVVSGSLNTDCQALTGAGSFTLASGATLYVCNADGIVSSGSTGAVQVTGTRSYSADASYIYNGSIAQNTGTGLPAQVRNLSTTNANTLTLTQAVAIRQVLALDGDADLTTNGQALTLLSDASGTALLANLGTGKNQVRGDITVQRYLDPSLNAGLGYRHLSAPVLNLTAAAFSTGGSAPVVNPAYNTAATPGTVAPFPTIFRYDQAQLATSPATILAAFDKGWRSPAALTDAADLGETGFTVQLPGAATLSFTGAAHQTGLRLFLNRASGATAADAGWNFVGNPFAAPLDFSTITASQRTDVDAAFYTFESTSRYGGNYRSYVNGVGARPLIGSSQAFWVRVSTGQTSGSLVLTNANRVTDYAQQAPVRRNAADTRPQLQLTLAGAGTTDQLFVYAQTGASAALDGEFDAAKLANSSGLNLATLTAAGQQLAIDGRPAFTAATSIPLSVGAPAAGSYSLEAAVISHLPVGLTAYLRDALTGTITALSPGTRYAFAVSTAQATALVQGRFSLQFSPAASLAVSPATLAAAVSLYPNPARAFTIVALPGVTGASTVQAELLNALGQVVRRQSAALPASGTVFTLPTDGLATGVYTLRLMAGSSIVTKRLTVE